MLYLLFDVPGFQKNQKRQHPLSHFNNSQNLENRFVCKQVAEKHPSAGRVLSRGPSFPAWHRTWVFPKSTRNPPCGKKMTLPIFMNNIGNPFLSLIFPKTQRTKLSAGLGGRSNHFDALSEYGFGSHVECLACDCMLWCQTGNAGDKQRNFGTKQC